LHRRVEDGASRAARARSGGLNIFIGLDHVHLYASDLDATVDFFRDMFDAKPVWDETAAGVRNVRLAIGRAFIQLYDQPPKAPRGGAMHHIGIETDDLDALVARMRSRGFCFVNPVRDDAKFRYVMIAGPDDLLIELFECREPGRWGIQRQRSSE
jgi:catechol 2,3-dioxygenase-like lactoylglutathione lyase family enzyme